MSPEHMALFVLIQTSVNGGVKSCQKWWISSQRIDHLCLSHQDAEITENLTTIFPPFLFVVLAT